jgi:hypothetical protein
VSSGPTEGSLKRTGTIKNFAYTQQAKTAVYVNTGTRNGLTRSI